MRERVLFSVILLLYLGLGFLFAIRTPAWQAPDEPAHYNYIAQVAAGDFLPVIELGDWDNDYLETLKASGFAPEHLANLDSVQYENHQPPLYYWLATPLFKLSAGNLQVLRLYSVLLGAITVSAAFFISLEIFPTEKAFALAVMALVAFVPQHLAILGSVNNDALAGVWIALCLWQSLRYLKGSSSQVWLLGLLVGLIAITKTTAYFMAGVVFIVLALKHFIDKERPPIFLKKLAAFALPAALFAGLYWLRNLLTYGFPDFLGLKRHDAIVVGQKRTAELISEVGLGAYFQQALQMTFQSFWGQFGWMAAPMNGAIPYIYTLIFALVLLAGTGLLLFIWQKKEIMRSQESAKMKAIAFCLGLVLMLSLLQVIYYNTSFVQFQGRYIFTGLIPFALGLVLGVDTWRRVLLGKWSWSAWLTTALFMLFALLDFYLIWRVIPGALT